MSEEDERKAFSARLNELCEDIGIPPKGQARQTTLAKILRVTPKGARKWLEGDGYPTMDKCMFIAKEANASFEWLMTGRGEKRFTGTKQTTAAYEVEKKPDEAATAQTALQLAIEAQRIANAWLLLPKPVRTRFARQLLASSPAEGDSPGLPNLNVEAVVSAIEEMWDAAPKRQDGGMMLRDGKAFAGFVASRLLPESERTPDHEKDSEQTPKTDS